MATRLRASAYLHASNPPRHPSWTNGAAFQATQLINDDPVVGADLYAYTEPASSAVGNYHWITLLSRPLAAQTLAGTVKGQFRVKESSTSADYMAQILIHVLDMNLNSKSVLLPLHSGALANEFVAADTNRYFPPVPNAALTPYACAELDMIAVELGFRSLNVTTSGFLGTLNLGGTTGLDLPEDQVATVAGVPWVEFSQDLVFAGPPTATLFGGLPVETVEFVPGSIVTTGQLWPRGY
jgi:hypothetical protein